MVKSQVARVHHGKAPIVPNSQRHGLPRTDLHYPNQENTFENGINIPTRVESAWFCFG